MKNLQNREIRNGNENFQFQFRFTLQLVEFNNRANKLQKTQIASRLISLDGYVTCMGMMIEVYLRHVAEDEHQSMGWVDGRIARWRGGVRVRPSPEQVSQVQRQRTRSVLEDDTLLLRIRLFGVSSLFSLSFLPAKRKKIYFYYGRERRWWTLVVHVAREIISNEWDCFHWIKVHILRGYITEMGRENIV